MHKKLLFLFLLCFVSYSGSAQIPNGGFETWTNMFFFENPNNWTTLNLIAGTANKEYSVFKTSDKYSGNFAARVKSVDMTGANPLAGFLPDTVGIMYCGTVDFDASEIKGFAVNQRHNELRFYYKYIPVNQDSAMVGLTFSKWDPATATRITVAIANFNIGAAASYTQNTLLINYLSSLVPDTAMLFVSASSLTQPQLGSELFIDDMSFEGINVGIEKQSKESKVSMFPNPATDYVAIQVNSDKAKSIKVISITGQVVFEGPITNRETRIDVRGYTPGIYFYQITGKDFIEPKTGKFIISR